MHQGSLKFNSGVNRTIQFVFSLSDPLSAPKNLRVLEEWYNRFRISWDVPPSPTMGYRIVYQPLSGNLHMHKYGLFSTRERFRIEVGNSIVRECVLCKV